MKMIVKKKNKSYGFSTGKKEKIFLIIFSITLHMKFDETYKEISEKV